MSVRAIAHAMPSDYMTPSPSKSTIKGVLESMPEALISALFVFVLASFAGFEVITKVPPTLHTPLMSGANAISGIAILGALIIAGEKDWNATVIMGLIAVVFATINVVGGFLVTDRMLQMFKKKEIKA
jgi:NAD(P) transhydrogenase subunit alpha